jgi:glycosyltransferase involved in cell wall biosynthesis
MSDSHRPRLLVLTVGLGVGGAEEIVHRSLPRIQAEGFDVTLGSLKRGGEMLEEFRQGGVRVESLGGSSPWNPGLLGRLWSWIRRERFDVIHSHLYWANLAARLSGRSAGVRAVINSHHGMDAWITPSSRWVERRTGSLADRVIACSEAVRQRALEVGLPEGKVVTVPNGIEVGRFSDTSRRESLRAGLGLAPDQPVVGSVGRLDEPVKGLAVLVEAMERVVKTLPRTVCLLAGEGPARPLLRDAIVARGLTESVRLLGGRRDVPDLLQALDLYVQPSRLEGFGLSVLEAMAAGKAVVASRVGGLPEVVSDGVTGDLVPPGDPAALASAILALLMDPQRRRQMGGEGIARAARCFPLEKMVRGWTAVYREILSGTRRREAA